MSPNYSKTSVIMLESHAVMHTFVLQSTVYGPTMRTGRSVTGHVVMAGRSGHEKPLGLTMVGRHVREVQMTGNHVTLNHVQVRKTSITFLHVILQHCQSFIVFTCMTNA